MPVESILTSVKKTLGVEEDYEHFDADIVIHINSAFGVLAQLGLPEGFTIADKTALWSEFIDNNPSLLALVKSYMYLKVRLLFDPPGSGILTDSMNRQATEFEWRIRAFAERGE